jgi:CRP/FNR family cyclic AMP-dependent transcriptional regulator
MMMRQTVQPRAGHERGMVLLGTGKNFHRELCNMMDGVDLFADFEWAEIEILADYLRPYSIVANDYLFREGDPGDFLCVLVQGKIRACKESDSSHSVLISRESAGRCLGEMALIDNEPRSATCITEEDSVVALLTREAYQRLSRERPALALRLLQKIARLMSRRLRVTSGRLIEHLGG